jgi:AraC-like DNA-binding protein
LSANSIAAEFGLSRASLYRLFGPAGGIAKYIRKARLSRAYQEITAAEFSNRRIGFIAYQLGFKNVSAFSRLFHEVYGVTPGEARERARQTVARPEYAIPAQPGESLTRWLDALIG